MKQAANVAGAVLGIVLMAAAIIGAWGLLGLAVRFARHAWAG